MLDVVKKTILAGIGATVTTKEMVVTTKTGTLEKLVWET